jgi:hypothetical protein
MTILVSHIFPAKMTRTDIRSLVWLVAAPRDDRDENWCGYKPWVDGYECVLALHNAMSTCDPDSGATHGAMSAGECINFVSVNAIVENRRSLADCLVVCYNR